MEITYQTIRGYRVVSVKPGKKPRVLTNWIPFDRAKDLLNRFRKMDGLGILHITSTTFHKHDRIPPSLSKYLEGYVSESRAD